MRNIVLALILQCSLNSIYAQTIGIELPNAPSFSNSYSFSVDATDTIWGGSSNTGLIKYYNGVTTNYTLSNSGIAANRCKSISIDSSGNIWTGGFSGISVFNHFSWILYNKNNSGISSDTVNCIANTNNGTWIGTNKGLCYFDGNTWTIYNASNSGILNDTVLNIACDNNNVFVTHPNGMSRLNVTWYTWLNAITGLATNNTQMIVSSGRLWFTQNHRNLHFLEQNTFISYHALLNKFKNRLDKYKLFGDQRGLASDKSGNIFFYLNNMYNATLVKINPDLKIKCSLIQPSSFYATGAMQASINENKMYLSGNGQIYRIQIDTSSFITSEYISGTQNDFLDINNITARHLNRGDMHWDPYQEELQYFSDISSNNHPVSNSGLWLGGIDQSGNLHTAAVTFRDWALGDYWTGPLDTVTGTSDSSVAHFYDRFWKIDYDMIQSFLINYQNGNLQNGSYTLPEAIASWPGNGNGNQSSKLAPYIDINGDGSYNPYDGDYPELTGHQTIWWMFNDTMPFEHHIASGSPALQFEIQVKAYAYNCNLNTSADEVMNNTTFYQYKLTNRSQNTYTDIHLGLWSILALGNSYDNYAGCDSMLNSYFAFNQDNDDEFAYGLNPPMINVTVLKGPLAITGDNLDNNHNGITDEPDETIGLNSFLYYQNVQPVDEPYTSDDYYEYSQAIWKDGMHVTYGEMGRNPNNPPTKYMFSGTPYDLGSSGWTMLTAGMMGGPIRAVGGVGPFTIAPGESQTIDFAYIFTRDSLNPNGLTTSIAKNTADVQKIIDGFNTGNYPCFTSVGLLTLANKNLDFQLYPNPVSNTLYFNKEMYGAEYEIYSVTGQLVKKGVFKGSGISTEQLQSQLYIIRAVKENQQYIKRFVKM